MNKRHLNTQHQYLTLQLTSLYPIYRYNSGTCAKHILAREALVAWTVELYPKGGFTQALADVGRHRLTSADV